MLNKKNRYPMSKELSVKLLWKNIDSILQPNKRRRLKRFLAAFTPLIESLNDGKTYTDEMIVADQYFEYLKCYHKSWQEVPLSRRARRQMIHRVRNGIELFNSIKSEGMKSPIEFIQYEAGKHIILGYRRLVILQVLGIKKAKALIHESFERYNQYHGKV